MTVSIDSFLHGFKTKGGSSLFAFKFKLNVESSFIQNSLQYKKIMNKGLLYY